MDRSGQMVDQSNPKYLLRKDLSMEIGCVVSGLGMFLGVIKSNTTACLPSGLGSEAIFVVSFYSHN